MNAVWLLQFSEVPVPFLTYSCEEGVGALGLCIPEPNQQMGATSPSSGFIPNPSHGLWSQDPRAQLAPWGSTQSPVEGGGLKANLGHHVWWWWRGERRSWGGTVILTLSLPESDPHPRYPPPFRNARASRAPRSPSVTTSADGETEAARGK